MASMVDAVANKKVWGEIAREFESKRDATTFEFQYVADFDTNGLLHWIATRKHSVAYQNPHSSELVEASMSSVHRGGPKNIVEHSPELSVPNYTKNAKFSWVQVDIGRQRVFLPNYYTIRHGGSGRGNAIRTWDFQARVLETDDWTTLRKHDDDNSVGDAVGSSASFPINDVVAPTAGGYRYFRIVQCGANSGGNDCLFIGGFELYGTLIERNI